MFPETFFCVADPESKAIFGEFKMADTTCYQNILISIGIEIQNLIPSLSSRQPLKIQVSDDEVSRKSRWTLFHEFEEDRLGIRFWVGFVRSFVRGLTVFFFWIEKEPYLLVTIFKRFVASRRPLRSAGSSILSIIQSGVYEKFLFHFHLFSSLSFISQSLPLTFLFVTIWRSGKYTLHDDKVHLRASHAVKTDAL